MISSYLRWGLLAGLLVGLSSLGTQLVFRTGLRVVFGILGERANRREPLGS